MKIYPNGDGTFCVSDGSWLPGVFESEAAAKLSVKLDDTVLANLWKKCLSEGREVLSWAEVLVAKVESTAIKPSSAGNTFSVQPSKVEIPEWSFDHEKYGNWD